MANQKTNRSSEEEQLLRQLRRHPELFERLKSIVALTESSEGSSPTADEIEAKLQTLIRELGKTTMESWGQAAEDQCAKQFKQKHPDASYGKKND